MYQFWLNTDDSDVIERLKVFTFLTREQIEAYEEKVLTEPFKREAQRELALNVTSLVHGEAAALASIAAAEALFGQGDLGALDAVTLAAALAELTTVDALPTASIAEVLLASGLVTSLGEARRAIAQGGVYLNNAKIEDESHAVGGSALAGGYAVLRRGKKTLAGIRIS